MQEKKETTAKKNATEKKKIIAEKKDPIKKEDTTKKEEDTTKEEDTANKEEPIKKEDPTPKEESVKQEDSVTKPHFSEKRIKEIVQRLRKQVAEFRQLQDEGKKPFYKRAPITVMEIPYIMLIIKRERGAASKLMKEMRAELGKKRRQKVSVTEFCKYTGIPISDVRDALNFLT